MRDGCPCANPRPPRSVCRYKGTRGPARGLGLLEGLSARGGACLGGVWAGSRWGQLEPRLSVGLGRGVDAQWVPKPRSISPEGQPGPGVVQPLQRAQVVRQ